MAIGVVLDFDNTVVLVPDGVKALRDAAMRGGGATKWAAYRVALDACDPVTLSSGESALDALRFAQACRWPVAIVSHSPTDVIKEWLDARLEVTPPIFGGDRLRPHYKPEPHGIDLALEALGITPSLDVIHVGDECTDHAAAQRAGVLPATWVIEHSHLAVAPKIFLPSVSSLRAHADRFALTGTEPCDVEVNRYMVSIDPSAIDVYSGPTADSVTVAGQYWKQYNYDDVARDQEPLSRDIRAWKDNADNTATVRICTWYKMLIEQLDLSACGEWDICAIPGEDGKAPPRFEAVLAACAACRTDVRIAVSEALKPVRAVKKQRKSTAEQRPMNRQGALTANDVEGRSIILLDDIVTSGATVSDAVRALHAGGADRIHVVALARTGWTPHGVGSRGDALRWNVKIRMSQGKQEARVEYLCERQAMLAAVLKATTNRIAQLTPSVDAGEHLVGETEAETANELADDDELGDSGAMINLGGLAKKAGDLDAARAWYEEAADLDNPKAMFNLGLLAKKAGDLDAARYWYEQAADRGNPKAMFNLGWLAEKAGKLDTARTCYQKAANLGNPKAMFNLGVLARKAGNPHTARAWYQKAANLGNPEAMASLGTLGDLED